MLSERMVLTALEEKNAPRPVGRRIGTLRDFVLKLYHIQTSEARQSG